MPLNVVSNTNSLEMGSIGRAPSTSSFEIETSEPSSLRSSLDSRYYQSQSCDVHLYDDAPLGAENSTGEYTGGVKASSWYGGLGDVEDFKQHLKVSIPLFSV